MNNNIYSMAYESVTKSNIQSCPLFRLFPHINDIFLVLGFVHSEQMKDQ